MVKSHPTFFANLGRNNALTHPPPLRKLPCKVPFFTPAVVGWGMDVSESPVTVQKRLCFFSVSARVLPGATNHSSESKKEFTIKNC